MSHRSNVKHRFEKNISPSVRSWKKIGGPLADRLQSDVIIQCGWGRLIMAHTFDDLSRVADVLLQEKQGERDIAFYLRDPHVVLSIYPEKLFLDPSHTYRLWLDQYKPTRTRPGGFIVRRATTKKEAWEINRIYASRKMVEVDGNFVVEHRNSRALTYFVAEDEKTGRILGTIMGLDHAHAFQDPENGSSFWCLAVDGQAPYPRVGEALIRHVIEYYSARGRTFLDLSVMHDNTQAIGLYEKMGFQRVPVFAIKRKNSINEPLFTDNEKLPSLNPYAEIIVKEAMRRGIEVEILDEERNHFALIHGGRRIVCWESLSEMTSAIALVRCDDKSLTRQMLAQGGLNVPEQQPAGSDDDNAAFLEEHGRIVVKPRQGEQGAGISVDIDDHREMQQAISSARDVSSDVLLEEYVQGQDLRIIVIDHKMVAAAVRRPAEIIGTGHHTVAQLIEKQSRRRAAATGGESSIPVDDETFRCLAAQNLDMDSVLEEGRTVSVRKTANLHTGGTIHDVTDQIHPQLVRAAEKGSRILDIPVVGFDFMVDELNGTDYAIIEANERPGLANHEPQPTAQRFVDLLFPQTAE